MKTTLKLKYIYLEQRQLIFHHIVGIPGGLIGGPRANQDQLRGFKSLRACSSGIFLAYKFDQRKARERESATFDENRRAVGMLNPMHDERK